MKCRNMARATEWYSVGGRNRTSHFFVAHKVHNVAVTTTARGYSFYRETQIRLGQRSIATLNNKVQSSVPSQNEFHWSSLGVPDRAVGFRA